MKKFFRKLIMLCAVLGVAGAPFSAAESREQTVRISIAGTNQTGTGYIVASGAAKLIDQYVDNVFATVEATSGSVENVKLIDAYECQMGISMNDVCTYGYRGDKPFTEAYANINMMLLGTPSVMHFVVPAESDIRSVADLKGKRVGVGAPGSSSESIMTPAILSGYGMSYADIEVISIGQAECVTGLSDNTIDAGVFYTAYPAAPVSELSTGKPVRVLPIDNPDFEKLKQSYPFFDKVVIPKDAYKGHTQDVNCVGVSTIMAVSRNLPEDVVYDIMKVLDEHMDEWKKIHSAAQYYTPARTATAVNGALPLHPGAVRYLKDKGLL